MTLPYDYARCNGCMQTRSDGFLNINIGQTMIMPPKFIDGKCPSRIGRDWERNEGND